MRCRVVCGEFNWRWTWKGAVGKRLRRWDCTVVFRIFFICFWLVAVASFLLPFEKEVCRMCESVR